MTPGEKEQVIFSTKPSFTILFVRSSITFLFIALCWIPLGSIRLSFFPNFSVLTEIGLIALWILASTYGYTSYYYTKYTLTNKRLAIQQGILGKSRRTMAVSRFQDVAFDQTFTERIFNIGNILIESAGEMGTFKIKEIGNFSKRREQISKLIDYS